MTAKTIECLRCGQSFIVASGPLRSDLAANRAVEWLNEHQCVPRVHRVVPVPLSLDEDRDGKWQWRCAHCDKRFRFPDEAEDSACSAIPLSLDIA